jgi:aspartate racemase
MADRLLGILGGMGPLASSDFVAKLIAATPAQYDQDHVPFMLWSVPQIPDRNEALAGTGPSPVPAMLHGLHALNEAGCHFAVIPCNTGHHWYDELACGVDLPILHIADAACRRLPKGTQKVGLIGTKGTIASGMYQQRLRARGIDCLVPSSEEMDEFVMPSIYAVKKGDLPTAGAHFSLVAGNLIDLGASTVLLACSEVPPALAAVDDQRNMPPTLDTTAALAQACVRWWLDGDWDL